jgi:hypothetical protein
MNCYLCLAEHLSLNAAGTCIECSQGACTKPSSRRDHVFHGDRCACGCRKFVCEADMDDHSRRVHSGSVPTCFPALAFQGSTRALATALQLPSAQDPTTRSDAVTVLNQFLNYIMPGQTLLWAARNELPTQYWHSELLVGRPSREGVFFYDLFFNSMTDRVASLALRTLGDSLRVTDLSSISKKLSAPVRSLITVIADEHGTAERTTRRVFDGPVEAATAVEQLNQWLPSKEALGSLPQIPPTLDDKAIVSWLFEPDLASSPSANA